jgi:hypothetical protein
MNFDELTCVWEECDQKLAASIRLNAQRLRSILTPHAAASANRPATGDIDYTMPVVLVQKQLHPHRIISIVQVFADSIRDGRRANHVVGKFEETVMRLLRRMRSLRS